MSWLVNSVRLRVALALAVGVGIGILATRRAGTTRHGCPRCPAPRVALRPPPSVKHVAKQHIMPPRPIAQDPSGLIRSGSTACPRAHRLVLTTDTVARVLPLRRNRHVRLNTGLELNFGGCRPRASYLGYSRNPALGGSRKHPKFFLLPAAAVRLE